MNPFLRYRMSEKESLSLIIALNRECVVLFVDPTMNEIIFAMFFLSNIKVTGVN